MKDKLTELIKQAKYCTAEELAEYLISAGLVLPTRCKECKYCHVVNGKYHYAYCEKLDYFFEPFQTDARTHFCSLGEPKETLGKIVDDILRLREKLHDEIEFDYNAEDVCE